MSNTRRSRPSNPTFVPAVRRPQDSSLAGIQRQVTAKPGKAAPIGGTVSRHANALLEIGSRQRSDEEIAANQWVEINTANKDYKTLKKDQEALVRKLVKDGVLPEGITPFAKMQLQRAIGTAYMNTDFARALSRNEHRFYRVDSSPDNPQRAEDFATDLWNSTAPTNPIARNAAAQMLPSMRQNFLQRVDAERNRHNIAALRVERFNVTSNILNLAGAGNPPIMGRDDDPDAFNLAYIEGVAKGSQLRGTRTVESTVPQVKIDEDGNVLYVLDANGDRKKDDQGNDIPQTELGTTSREEPLHSEARVRQIAWIDYQLKQRGEMTYSHNGASGTKEIKADILKFAKIKSEEIRAMSKVEGKEKEANEALIELSHLKNLLADLTHGRHGVGSDDLFMAELNTAVLWANAGVDDANTSSGSLAAEERLRKDRINIAMGQLYQAGEDVTVEAVMAQYQKTHGIDEGSNEYHLVNSLIRPSVNDFLSHDIKITPQIQEWTGSAVSSTDSPEDAANVLRATLIANGYTEAAANAIVIKVQSALNRTKNDHTRNTQVASGSPSLKHDLNPANAAALARVILKPVLEELSNKHGMHSSYNSIVTNLNALGPVIQTRIHNAMAAERADENSTAQTIRAAGEAEAERAKEELGNLFVAHGGRWCLNTEVAPTFLPEGVSDKIQDLESAEVNSSTQLVVQADSFGAGGQTLQGELDAALPEKPKDPEEPAVTRQGTPTDIVMHSNRNELFTYLAGAIGVSDELNLGRDEYSKYFQRLHEVAVENPSVMGNFWRNLFNWTTTSDLATPRRLPDGTVIGAMGHGPWVPTEDIPIHRRNVMWGLTGAAQNATNISLGRGQQIALNMTINPGADTPTATLMEGGRDKNIVHQRGWSSAPGGIMKRLVAQGISLTTEDEIRSVIGTLWHLAAGSPAQPLMTVDEKTGKRRVVTLGELWGRQGWEADSKELIAHFVHGATLPMLAPNNVIYAEGGVYKVPDSIIPTRDNHGNFVITDEQRESIISAYPRDNGETIEYLKGLMLGGLATPEQREWVEKTARSPHGVDLSKFPVLLNPYETSFSADPKKYISSLDKLNTINQGDDPVDIDDLFTDPRTKNLECVRAYEFYREFVTTVNKRSPGGLPPMPFANFLHKQSFGVMTQIGGLLGDMKPAVKGLITRESTYRGQPMPPSPAQPEPQPVED